MIKINKIVIGYSLIFTVILSLSLDYYDTYYKFLIFILLHEIGHLITCKILRIKMIKFKVTGFGCFLETEFIISKFKKLIVYISGIVINIVFILFQIESKINTIILLFNIIPIYPLDGFHIIKSLKQLLKINKFILFVIRVILLILIFMKLKSLSN